MAKFGWCLTNQHEVCTKEFGTTKCACDCGEVHGQRADGYMKEQRKVEE